VTVIPSHPVSVLRVFQSVLVLHSIRRTNHRDCHRQVSEGLDLGVESRLSVLVVGRLGRAVVELAEAVWLGPWVSVGGSSHRHPRSVGGQKAGLVLLSFFRVRVGSGQL
jgi:hypothetical protein